MTLILPILLGLFLCGLGIYCTFASVKKYAKFYGIAGDGSAIRGWMLSESVTKPQKKSISSLKSTT